MCSTKFVVLLWAQSRVLKMLTFFNLFWKLAHYTNNILCKIFVLIKITVHNTHVKSVIFVSFLTLWNWNPPAGYQYTPCQHHSWSQTQAVAESIMLATKLKETVKLFWSNATLGHDVELQGSSKKMNGCKKEKQCKQHADHEIKWV